MCRTVRKRLTTPTRAAAIPPTFHRLTEPIDASCTGPYSASIEGFLFTDAAKSARLASVLKAARLV